MCGAPYQCALAVRHAAGVLLGVGWSAAGLALAVDPFGKREEQRLRATGAHSDRCLTRFAVAVGLRPPERSHQSGLLQSEKDGFLC